MNQRMSGRFHRALWVVVPVIVLGAAVACREAEDASAFGSGTVPAQTVTKEQPPHVSAQAGRGEAACEDFGSLSGTSLEARSSGTTAATSMAVANRPSFTKLAVSAYGSASSLSGRSVSLGTAENANLATCTHCIAIAIGCTETSCKDAAWFYPRSGNATFTNVGYEDGNLFEGTFDDVILEQVKVDFDTLTTTPVGGGACVRVPSLAFSASVVRTSADGGGVGLTDSDGGGGNGGNGGNTASDGGSKSSGGGGLLVELSN